MDINNTEDGWHLMPININDTDSSVLTVDDAFRCPIDSGDDLKSLAAFDDPLSPACMADLMEHLKVG